MWAPFLGHNEKYLRRSKVIPLLAIVSSSMENIASRRLLQKSGSRVGCEKYIQVAAKPENAVPKPTRKVKITAFIGTRLLDGMPLQGVPIESDLEVHVEEHYQY
jgi:hypothetical protein